MPFMFHTDLFSVGEQLFEFFGVCVCVCGFGFFFIGLWFAWINI